MVRKWFAPAGLFVIALALAVFVLTPGGAPASASSTPNTTTSTAAPSAAGVLASGRTLFDENCSSCHGINAAGSSLAPNLRGLGSGTVDLWVSSGWMPLAVPTAQPMRGPDRFNPQQTLAIAQYVGSLSNKGVKIPTVDLSGASVSDGFALYAENCAACHTITGAGDALSNGLSAPALRGLSPVLVTEAIETAPGNMPRFTPGALTPAQVNDVVAYVTEDIGHPSSPGGLGLGGVGPVAEGFVGLFVGVGGCLLIAMWVGDRTESEDDDADLEGGHSEVAHA